MFKCKCKRCGKEFHSEHKCSYCSDECKNKLEQLTCDCCGKTFIGNTNKFRAGKIYCSEKCRVKMKNRKTQNDIIEKRQERLSEGVEGYDYIVCRLCGLKAVQLNINHFNMCHPGIDVKKYQEMFPDAPLTCDRFIEQNLKGENNPRSAAKISQEEIRKHSPYCKEFYEVRGLDDSVRQEMVRKIADRPIERFAGSMEYYLAQGYTREEAIKIRKERYGFTLEKCISKYGEEEGRRFYLDRQERWMNTMYSKDDSCKCKSNISRVSQEFIFDVLGNCCDRTDIFLFGKNEYEITGTEHVYKYDLTCLENKRIIEFHGDLWHGNPLLFEASDRNGINGQLYADKWKYDAEKKETAEKNGFEVMVVWERDYKYYKEDVIEKSKDFIFNGVDIDVPECKCCRNKEIKSFKLF